MATALQAEVVEEPIEALANPVMSSSGHIIAVTDEPTAELEGLFVLKPRDD
ncbi:MAG TPA: hypothetical protein VGU20_25565 [Stellaceae bacterium]|nr:hypothetical protein [Stellaceae bacterium]